MKIAGDPKQPIYIYDRRIHSKQTYKALIAFGIKRPEQINDYTERELALFSGMPDDGHLVLRRFMKEEFGIVLRKK